MGVIVVGGGPAGTAAAVAVASAGCPVVLYNKNPLPWKKVTGTPADELFFGVKLPPRKMAAHFRTKGEFVGPIFKSFGFSDLVGFLKKLDIPAELDDLGRLHANGYRINEIGSLVNEKMQKFGIRCVRSARVTDVVVENGRVKGIIINRMFKPATAVVLATGSISAPRLGSTDDGYRIAQKLGHPVIPVKPAMVDLVTKQKIGRILAGETVHNVGLTLFYDGDLMHTAISSIKFTENGVSGPFVLDRSAEIVDNLSRVAIELSIDWLPTVTKEELDRQLTSKPARGHLLQVRECLPAGLNEKAILAVAKAAHVPLDKSIARLTNLERKALVLALKDFRLTIIGAMPFNYTRGVIGGVSTEAINPSTGESRLVKSLYFAGSVLDILGPWGGYNMQFAISSGHVAGKAAATALRSE